MLKHRLKEAAEDGIVLAVKWFAVLVIWLLPGYVLAQNLNILAAQAHNGQEAYQFLVKDNNWKTLEKLAKDNRDFKVESK